MKPARPLIALAAALVVGGWLLFAPADEQVAPTVAPSGAGTRTADLRPVTTPARLPDGSAFTPMLYVGADTSVGTAGAAAERLVLRSPAGVRELRSMPVDRFPQYLGLTAADGFLYWAESSATPAGPYETRLWRAQLTGAAPPVSLTADTGGIVFFDSQNDLVVSDGRLRWVAALPDDSARTELRAVPVAGGPVQVTVIEGRFRWSTWPWLLSVDPGAPTLLDSATGQRRSVPAAAAETVGCTPVWCRALVQTGNGNTLLDVMRADGDGRHRLPDGVNAIGVDVGVLDRFELLTAIQGESLRLLAYDLQDRQTVVLAADIGITTARAGFVWWATGSPDPVEWHVLDLRQLA